MDRVEDGSVLLTANEFPSFLYETGTIYDEKNEEVGLFRGFLLVRVGLFFIDYESRDVAFQVFRHIFTGPSTAMNSSTGPHKTKAKKFKLTEVTGRTIAYASVQASGFPIVSLIFTNTKSRLTSRYPL